MHSRLVNFVHFLCAPCSSWNFLPKGAQGLHRDTKDSTEMIQLSQYRTGYILIIKEDTEQIKLFH